MLMAGQIRMARSFFEEVKDSSVRFHHLFINNLTDTNRKQTAGEEITPEIIGEYIITLYKDDKPGKRGPFLFFMGKGFPDMQHYFNNN